MSKKRETYHVGLSVYRQGRGKHHWAVSDDVELIANGDKGTHKEAKKIGLRTLCRFCQRFI